MKIYFVRHGHPNYENDCLTPLGHMQAEAAAERLKDFGIETIYSSTKGRALQTAQHTADKTGLDVIPCEFIREIGWKSTDPDFVMPHNGNPWKLARHFDELGIDLLAANWREKEPYSKSDLIRTCKRVIEGTDAWLHELGYQREGDYYRVIREDTKNAVAMFSHGGASSAVLSHMFNIPFPQFCGAFHIDFTSITLVELEGEIGELIYPKFIYAGDHTHILSLEEAECTYSS